MFKYKIQIPMKKLLYVLLSFSILFLAAPNQNASAQIVKSESITGTSGAAKTSLSSADTAYALSGVITSTHKSVEIDATKTSGTVGGKVYFQGKILSTSTWVSIDSLTVGNTSGLQYNLITVPSTLKYSDYRVYFLSTGGVWVPAVYTLRRN